MACSTDGKTATPGNRHSGVEPSKAIEQESENYDNSDYNGDYKSIGAIATTRKAFFGDKDVVYIVGIDPDEED